MTVDEALLEKARAATGLKDFGDVDGFRIGLRILLAELERAALGEPARDFLLAEWQRRLEVRLKIVDLRKRRPDIAAQRIEGPLVVTGLPRSGTTSLIDLLVQDPTARGLLTWEALNLFPPADPEHWQDDPRIAEYDAKIAVQPEAVAAAGLHIYGARLPEECSIIQLYGFWGARFPGEPEAVELAGAAEWIRWSGPPEPYTVHRWILQQLQTFGSAGRWTLKNPAHIFALGEMIDTYPDAMIVQTHRDPQALFPSLCGLICTIRGQQPGDPRRAETARYLLARWSSGIHRCMAARRDPAVDGRIIDLGHRQIVSDPLGAAQAIYERFDLPFTDLVEKAMAAWIAAPAQHESKLRFTLDEFGLTAEDVEQASGPYRNRFSRYFQ